MALPILPKGNPVHEILSLPSYWLGLSRIDISSMKATRYTYGDHYRQYFLLVPPPEGVVIQDKIIVYFHGGGWKFGKPEQFKPSVKVFHEAGYPVLLPSLRRTPYYNYFDMREDLNLLLLRIQEVRREKNWKDRPLVLGGMSAGGNLAALLCFDHHELGKLNISPTLFAGLLALGAPLNLEQMQDSLLLRAFAGPRGSEQFRLANPLEHWRNHAPSTPVFCIHGQCDGLVAYECAETFVETLAETRPDKIRFVAPENGTHLEAAAWGHTNAKIKREILSWLRKL